MLIGALHQVRDEVLKGKIPVVFWDEFDSDNLQWLKFMLAPMNDGEFLEGQVTHPIGKCIFIFAGGTCSTYEEFSQRKRGKEASEFKAVKGTDFVSRLQGYLNVLGPNPRMIGSKVDEADIGYPIRRALLLRSFTKSGKKKLQIHWGLLSALLRISSYKHGARSMGAVVNLISAGGQRDLLPANLPSREQLSLHVSSYDEFMDHVQKAGAAFKLQAEHLAPVIHQFYLDLAEKEGWEPTYPQPYEELPDVARDSNIAAARRLPDILSLVGLTIAKAGGSKSEETKIKALTEKNIELLAEAEHIGWMAFLHSRGWTYGKERCEKEKLHPALMAYVDLSEQEKGKDRDSVRNYSKIVRIAGFRIVVEE